jgi:hypothetical protein
MKKGSVQDETYKNVNHSPSLFKEIKKNVFFSPSPPPSPSLSELKVNSEEWQQRINI